MIRFLLCAGVVACAAGCASELELEDAWEGDDALIAAGDLDNGEEPGSDGDGAQDGRSALGTGQLVVRTNANFRIAAGLGSEILRVLPTGTRVTLSSSANSQIGWLPISYRGLNGYMASSLLVASTTPEVSTAAGARREEILSRARGALGYSYWRGRSRWRPFEALPGEPTEYTPGVSTGGTDCSGLVGKVWQVPAWNTNTLDHKRAYVTRHFRYSTSREWMRVSRSQVLPADAYVWNDGAATGHIVLVRGTDAWGSVLTMEAKGKKYGIVEDTRKSMGSQYVAIRLKDL